MFACSCGHHAIAAGGLLLLRQWRDYAARLRPAAHPLSDTTKMAQYVYTMNRVSKIVPPKRRS